MNSLSSLLLNKKGKGVDKWLSYLPVYEDIFESYRAQKINILEIGIQNGGGLEIYGQYFKKAESIIGCDINADCNTLEFYDDRISIVVGDASTQDTKNRVTALSESFNIVIDDGSHTSHDIIMSLCHYLPLLEAGGIYVVEDLHCSYWSDFDGGLYYPYSSINILKAIADVVNSEFFGTGVSRSEYMQPLLAHYGCRLSEKVLESIETVQFYNSMCIIKKTNAGKCELGERVVRGDEFNVDSLPLKQNGLGLNVPDQISNPWAFKTSSGMMNFMENFEKQIANLISAVENVGDGSSKLSDDPVDKIQSLDNKTTAIIIPYYNGMEFIDRCLESVLKQEEPYNEIIIVDDGSKADHADYLEKFKFIQEVKVFHKENGGQGSARNFGARESTSEFITFLDQDDFVKTEHNKVLKKALTMQDDDVGYVYADAIEADGCGNVIRHGLVKEHSTHPKSHLHHFLGQDCFILPSAMMITRKAFMDVEGFDSSFTGYEDDDLVLRLWRKGYRGFFVDVPVYIWCIHFESTSFSVKMSRSRMRYIKKLLNMFPTHPEFNRFYFRDLVYPRFVNSILAEFNTAKISKHHTDEYFGFYNDFLEMAINNRVSYKTIIKLRAFGFLVRNLPYSLSKYLLPAYKRFF